MRLEIVFIVFATILGGTLSNEENYARIKRRMYAMCPPRFIQIGAECYYISDTSDSWLEAHFRCKDKNSKLAEPEKMSDRRLRTFLNSHDIVRSEIWIGGQYNDKTNIWQWGISGRNFSYQSFSQKDPRSSHNYQYHCAVFDPKLRYRWSARPCLDNHRYICQHKMPKVSENHRTKIYNRWNITYPNEMANEVELEVIESRGNGSRIHRRVKPINSNDVFSYPLNSKQNRRQSNIVKQRRRPFVTTSPSRNDANHVYLSNGVVQTQQTSPSPDQIERRRIQQQKRRNRLSTPEPAYNNETVERKNDPIKTKEPRQKKDFDRAYAEKRRQERERKRKLREHRLKRKLLRERERRMREQQKLDEEQNLKQQREREQQELETIKRQEMELIEKEQNEAKYDEEQRRLPNHRQKMFEEQVRQDEEKRAKEILENEQKQREDEQKQREQEEKENRRREEENRRREEENHRREEDNRRRNEIEEARRRQEDEDREIESKRKMEEKLANERRKSVEAEARKREELELEQRRRDEFERRQREEEFDNNIANQPFHDESPLESEDGTYRRHAHDPQLINADPVVPQDNEQNNKDEKDRQRKIEEEREAAERLHKERLHEEAELARLQEEQRKRAEIQRLREEEIQRRETVIREQAAEEKSLQEDMRRREHEMQLQREEEQRQLEEKLRREEEEKRIETERREASRRNLELLRKKAEEGQKLEEKQLEEQDKTDQKQQFKERLAKLTPSQRKAFFEKMKQKKNRKHNNESERESAIPE